jgi:hypothetical protein
VPVRVVVHPEVSSGAVIYFVVRSKVYPVNIQSISILSVLSEFNSGNACKEVYEMECELEALEVLQEEGLTGGGCFFTCMTSCNYTECGLTTAQTVE